MLSPRYLKRENNDFIQVEITKVLLDMLEKNDLFVDYSSHGGLNFFRVKKSKTILFNAVSENFFYGFVAGVRYKETYF